MTISGGDTLTELVILVFTDIITVEISIMHPHNTYLKMVEVPIFKKAYVASKCVKEVNM